MTPLSTTKPLAARIDAAKKKQQQGTLRGHNTSFDIEAAREIPNLFGCKNGHIARDEDFVQTLLVVA
ncbi:hypothetical protein [Hydrogenophaga sp.]|uniref:hypothetical protein n=1 Tax=Hydrogenophaga sp. TaxID=1904254 RepID=UPI000AA2B13D|nr:hypothetical protein [Hydrogenophaga sp.]